MDILSRQPQPFNTAPESRLYRILVVDDSPVDLQFILNGLSDHYAVSFATSAKEAICLAHQFPQPDLILLDVVMPETDGYTTCSKLKNDVNTQNIPVIFVTNLQDTTDKTKGFNAGAVDYITKPLHLAELNARIQTHIRLKEQSQYFEFIANFDALTHVPNRRKYNETLHREWARCIRYEQPISIIIIDIDFFKQFNERHGHSEGDNCLIKVAQLLEKQGNRPTDLFARVGGEEFVMLLPDCDIKGAVIKAEKMQAVINNAEIPHGGVVGYTFLSVSLGVASISPNQSQDAISLFQQADDALFKAKRNGRNRIAIAQTNNIADISRHSAI